MALPVYSEISNFSYRKNEIRKFNFSLSCVFITTNLSSSIESLNSLYSLISKNKQNIELIIINLDKITYNYDTIFTTFPFVRIFFVKDKATIKEIFHLGIEEAFAKNILFIKQDYEILSLDLDMLNIYLSEISFGIIQPLIFNENEEIVPNIVKITYKEGLLTTYSTDIVGADIPSLYPKYFCFIINKNAIFSDLDLYDYENEDYFLLELGYRLWKNGFTVTQARNFKAFYMEEKDDIDISNDLEYLIFNLRNIKYHSLSAGRGFFIFKAILKNFLKLNLNYISKLRKSKKQIKKHFPIEDLEILSIINKDIP
ncbi:MAG: hypothetical protein N2258_00980 [Brevinematales bacterium]|nr:hypothetical protein [Brevinematales bacterium]